MPSLPPQGATFTEVPGSRFTVGRKVEKKGQSTYFFNGRAATFNAIVAHLGRFGLDVENNRFLILQVRAAREGTDGEGSRGRGGKGGGRRWGEHINTERATMIRVLRATSTVMMSCVSWLR